MTKGAINLKVGTIIKVRSGTIRIGGKEGKKGSYFPGGRGQVRVPVRLGRVGGPFPKCRKRKKKRGATK